MEKEFEALEIGVSKLKKLYKNSAKKMSKNDILGFDLTFVYLDKALTELKAIKEAKPSEAMEILETLADDGLLNKEIGAISYNQIWLKNQIEVLKQALLKAQELEKENGLTLKDLVSKHIINPNSVVDVYEQDKNNPHYSNRIFKGMAWKMEKGEIGNRKLKHIFSAVAETISESDRICIEVEEND